MNDTRHDLGLCSDLDAIDQFLKVDGRFLVDAGCGNMNLSRALAQRGAHVLGIDPDPIQARQNQQADVVANVGFAQTGADTIPVENKSVDGILFPYSLHHIPAEQYPAVFTEVLRVLKADGFLYVIEPLASGNLNEVMRLFHDEAAVRLAAQKALDTLAVPVFSDARIINYRIPVHYNSWDEYATRYASKSFNTKYTEAQVRDKAVEQRFRELGEPCNYEFESPMQVTYLQHPNTADHN